MNEDDINKRKTLDDRVEKELAGEHEEIDEVTHHPTPPTFQNIIDEATKIFRDDAKRVPDMMIQNKKLDRPNVSKNMNRPQNKAIEKSFSVQKL